MSGLPREAPCGAPDQLNLCPSTTAGVVSMESNFPWSAKSC